MQFIAVITSFLGAIFALGIFVADILIAIAVFRDAAARQKAGKKLMFLIPAQSLSRNTVAVRSEDFWVRAKEQV